MTAVLAMTAVAGCGSQASSDAPQAGTRSDRLVDFSKKPPYVNALDVDPVTGEYLLTTNRGHWRIDPDGDEVTQVRGRIAAQGKSSTVGTFLELLVTGPGQLLGSGHPDQKNTLPQYLGLIRSDDMGRNWEVVSGSGRRTCTRSWSSTGGSTASMRSSEPC